MSSTLRIWGACRTLAVRSRPAPIRRTRFFVPDPVRTTRWYSDETTKDSNKLDGTKVVEDGLDKAAKVAEEVGASLAEIASDAEIILSTTEQASPDMYMSDAQLEQMFYGGRATKTDGEGGLTEAQEQVLYQQGSIPPAEEAEAIVELAETEQTAVPVQQPLAMDAINDPGHKFGLPKKPYPDGFHLKKRYHPILEQLSRLLMKDGKLSVAQRNMAMVMNVLRTSPAPIYSPMFPLLPGTPPAAHLPLNPILYLVIAIDSVAPLMKIKNIAGAAGGGRALEMPTPLPVRARRRIAFQWILDVVNKKPSKGSGRKQLPIRIAEEIIAVVEGRSSVWEKRRVVHKLGTAARANVGKTLMVKKKK